MQSKNFININIKERDKAIYRYLSFDRLIEIFQRNQFPLTSPNLWDDPFENFILKSSYKVGKEKIRLDIYNKCYASSWSLAAYSDAMWRIYSPDKNGVRIKTTIKKLVQSLSHAYVEFSDISVFIGKVKYYSSKELEKKSKRLASFLSHPTGRYFAESLLFKRSAFKHEREVRLIYFDYEHKIKGGVLQYDCSPHEIIESVVIDPRANERTVELYKHYLKTKLGFKKRVYRSTLYDPPKKLLLELED